MDQAGRTVWQQAAGDTDRDYSRVCLEWDVILNGPGEQGAWPECRQALANEGWSARKLTDLRRFAEEMADGDLVILRLGTATVMAVGEVVGDYEWSDEFGDVDGWDIQHIRRVRWLQSWPDEPQAFDTYTLKLGDTTQRLDSEEIGTWLSGLHVSDDEKHRPLVALPIGDQASRAIGLDDVSGFLFDYGVASDSIARLLNDIGELARIANWYRRQGMPSEHETVAYLVIPLLRALGWTPQRMAVEWNKVDVALFSSLPRADETITVVVEAKKMSASCLSAVSQAQSYAQGKARCRRLIVTDGLRYGIYTRNETGDFTLSAYMNLTRLRSAYPIYHCGGAREALLAMAPEWTE